MPAACGVEWASLASTRIARGSEAHRCAHAAIRLRVDGQRLLAECDLAIGERLLWPGPRGGEDFTVLCAHVEMGC